MLSHRRILILTVIGAAALAVGIWMLRPPRSAISWENAAKVRPGMALAEVEAALGGPARFDANGKVSYCLTEVEGLDPAVRPDLEWISDDVLVMVYLDTNKRVRRCDALAVRREDRTIVEIVRRWLGR